MADFKQAVEWMKEGKKVKLRTWVDGSFCYLKKPLNIFIDNRGVEAILLSQFEATDWEIYEENDWNLNDEFSKLGNIPCMDNDDALVVAIEDIKTLKEKIIEDLGYIRVRNFDYGKEMKEILDKRFGF